MLVLACIAAFDLADTGRSVLAETGNPPESAASTPTPWTEIFTPATLLATLALLTCSAFFSSCEVAFFSLNPLDLRSMRENGRALDRLAARLMEHPGNLLTSILMGNSIANVFLAVVLAANVEKYFEETLLLPAVAAFAGAVSICTAFLVFFGEITPKLIVVRRARLFARYAALPIQAIDWCLKPLRDSMIAFVGFLFRVTRFSEVPPVPFMTDEEFKSLLSESEAAGAIEKDERQMIQGILEFTDAAIREILVPRPDMVTLPEDATAGQALALIRQHEFARIPVFRDHLDQITGVLYAKDLLPSVHRGDFDQPIAPLLHKVHFVPETMTAADFIKSAQRLRAHLAIVVDEYGGTEGIVTLQDALREVVGDIGEEDQDETAQYTEVQKGVYQVEGSFPLDELENLTGVAVEDGEHTTVAGFLMEKSEKILEIQDQIEHEGVLYTIEKVDGKRVAKLQIKVLPQAPEESQT